MKKFIILLSLATALPVFANVNIKQKVINVSECSVIENHVNSVSLDVTYEKSFLEIQTEKVHNVGTFVKSFFMGRPTISINEEVTTTTEIKTLRFRNTETETAEEVCSKLKE